MFLHKYSTGYRPVSAGHRSSSRPHTALHHSLCSFEHHKSLSFSPPRLKKDNCFTTTTSNHFYTLNASELELRYPPELKWINWLNIQRGGSLTLPKRNRTKRLCNEQTLLLQISRNAYKNKSRSTHASRNGYVCLQGLVFVLSTAALTCCKSLGKHG